MRCDSPSISGVGSTKGTIQLSKEAAAAGADFAIVIPSGYYAGALGREALKKYFVDVAEASPIPVMIYNCAYQGCCKGLSEY
jgi:4-hydroxy-2-oxoglutarate aldolase